MKWDKPFDTRLWGVTDMQERDERSCMTKGSRTRIQEIGKQDSSLYFRGKITQHQLKNFLHFKFCLNQVFLSLWSWQLLVSQWITREVIAQLRDDRKPDLTLFL